MELLSKLSVVRLDAGETVLREGEAGDACYLIAAGKVRVTKAGVQVAELGPGSFFGEFAVLSDQRRHASVQATEPFTPMFGLSGVTVRAKSAGGGGLISSR